MTIAGKKLIIHGNSLIFEALIVIRYIRLAIQGTVSCPVLPRSFIVKLNTPICTLLLGLLFVGTVQADYILTAPPRESAMKGAKLYGPLALKLSELLGKKVIYEQPKNWLDYSRNMRMGRYDIVFDGPHFSAWRMKHLKHQPVAALPGALEFVLVTHADNPHFKKPRDIAGKRICGMPSPQLATDMILSLYPNPSIQPIIYEVPGGIKKMYKAFKAGKCHATIFRIELFEKLPANEKSKLKIVARTDSLPNQTVTISKRLRKNAPIISGFLTSKKGAMTANNLLSRYSKSAMYFQKPTPVKYKDVELVLEGIVFGW